MEEDLERYETEVELKIYKEYHDVLPMFRYVVETERRFYLANHVDLNVRDANGSVFFEVEMRDAWVWDMFRPARFLEHVRVMTFRDVNVEELERQELSI
jgi:hypothetical protein